MLIQKEQFKKLCRFLFIPYMKENMSVAAIKQHIYTRSILILKDELQKSQ